MDQDGGVGERTTIPPRKCGIWRRPVAIPVFWGSWKQVAATTTQWLLRLICSRRWSTFRVSGTAAKNGCDAHASRNLQVRSSDPYRSGRSVKIGPSVPYIRSMRSSAHPATGFAASTNREFAEYRTVAVSEITLLGRNLRATFWSRWQSCLTIRRRRDRNRGANWGLRRRTGDFVHAEMRSCQADAGRNGPTSSPVCRGIA